MDKFVHLHRHDEYSLFDGMGTSAQAAKYVAELGQPALAITNHGNVCGIIDHFNNCREQGIKPIIGIEGYFVPSLKKYKEKQSNYHLTILAKDGRGYQNLMQLVTRSNKDGFYYRPRFDFVMLEEFKEGLIVLSGCQAGFIAKMLYSNRHDLALKAAKRFKSIFGDDFYIEVQPHNIHDQRTFNKLLIDLAETVGIEVVMTSDAHFIRKEDLETHQVMRSLKSDFGGYPEAYISSRKQALEMWNKYHGFGRPKRYIDTILEIADKCNVELNFSNLIPRIDFGMDSKIYLKKLAIQGLKEKGKWKDEYKERLKKELNVIFTKGFEDYFLICWDIITWAKNNGVATDFGRGSVGGSLLAYALGITQVDPLIHGTVFERFLRPDKTTMPDIDMDFDKRYRDKVISYIDKRFPQRSAPIVAYGLYKVKNLLGDLCKKFNVTKEDKELIVKRIFDLHNGEEPKSVDYNELLADKHLRKLNSKYNNILLHFSKLYGQISYFGRHASGIAICGKKIDNYVGLMRSHNTLVTSFNLKEIEKLGILKMDILGLETASVISETEQIAGVKFDESILNDKATIKQFQLGNTDSIFQFEKEGAKELLRRVKPRNFNELVAVNALNRPAPIKLGVVDAYIDAKNGNIDKKSPWYKYTKETYGTIIYQEQVMKICRGLAKMDWPDVDKVMKSLRSSNDEDDPLMKKFVEGAVKNGANKQEAKDLYENMTKYLFNKAHATAYTLLSFYAMWLMVHHPLEYIYALLSNEDVESKIRTYQALAARKEIIILPPHVNGSANFSITEFGGEKVIQAGLTSIKGIGLKVAEEIVSRGPYNCIELVEQRVPKRIFNLRVKQILIENGAMEFDKDKYCDQIIKYNSKLLMEYNRRVKNG